MLKQFDYLTTFNTVEPILINLEHISAAWEHERGVAVLLTNGVTYTLLNVALRELLLESEPVLTLNKDGTVTPTE